MIDWLLWGLGLTALLIGTPLVLAALTYIVVRSGVIAWHRANDEYHNDKRRLNDGE